ncbi:MAG TPA: hypothetical protein VGL12_15350 [Roseiarcus sp.]|jgi:hypothetical protein
MTDRSGGDEHLSFMGSANGRQGVRDEEEARPGYMDHMERARRRISELRAQYGDLDDEDSDVYLDRFYAEAPPGWTYEWKTHTVFNKQFPHYTNQLLRSGWAPVPASRHRELLYPEYTDESVILEGLMLMERPKELTERRRMRERIKATDQVRNSEAKLVEAPAGTAPRDQHRKTQPRVGSTVGPIGVPD